MDAGTHLFVGVVTATALPSFSLTQKLLVIIFALLPDAFEWLDYIKMREISTRPHHEVRKKDFVKLGIRVRQSVFMMPYHFLHSLVTITIFLIISIIYQWPIVYAVMWSGHILLDIPSHEKALGIRLWYPFFHWHTKGSFDWWALPFLKDKHILGYWAILLTISLFLIQKFW
ncbi:MAG: hypothetical protein NTV81_04755 [Candidatus Komeilibacteria bacterium]|nr:hypothetical protein [Candidatus Komeilibacteria bacterium]